MRQERVVLGTTVTLDDGSRWMLWSDGTKAGRYWAYQRGAVSTVWLEVYAVTQPDGHRIWSAAK